MSSTTRWALSLIVSDTTRSTVVIAAMITTRPALVITAARGVRTVVDLVVNVDSAHRHTCTNKPADGDQLASAVHWDRPFLCDTGQAFSGLPHFVVIAGIGGRLNHQTPFWPLAPVVPPGWPAAPPVPPRPTAPPFPPAPPLPAAPPETVLVITRLLVPLQDTATNRLLP